jgi:hypothetical protein
VKSVASQCTNYKVHSEWLVADCLTGEDATTRIQSAVALMNKVSNNDGALKWQTE